MPSYFRCSIHFYVLLDFPISWTVCVSHLNTYRPGGYLSLSMVTSGPPCCAISSRHVAGPLPEGLDPASQHSNSKGAVTLPTSERLGEHGQATEETGLGMATAGAV